MAPRHLTFRFLIPALALVPCLALAQNAPSPNRHEAARRVIELLEVEAMPIQLIQALVGSGVQQAKAAMTSLRLTPEVTGPASQDFALLATQALDDLRPVVRRAAIETRYQAIPLLEEQFSDSELSQLAAFLESPLRRKLDKLLPEVQGVVARATSDMSRSEVDARLKRLSAELSRRVEKAAMETPGSNKSEKDRK